MEETIEKVIQQTDVQEPVLDQQRTLAAEGPFVETTVDLTIQDPILDQVQDSIIEKVVVEETSIKINEPKRKTTRTKRNTIAGPASISSENRRASRRKTVANGINKRSLLYLFMFDKVADVNFQKPTFFEKVIEKNCLESQEPVVGEKEVAQEIIEQPVLAAAADGI